ncbi:MAG: class I SAM-dependent methyltransferase [Planctomycetota bacterium]|jgi:ubiquinone/menaquinone biosynthesis C-methylase UbiE
MSSALDYKEIADLYDSYVRFDEDIPFFLDACKGIKGPVLELTAGTGRVSIPLVEAGVNLTCVDSSKEMLDVLEKKLETKGLSAATVCEDMTKLKISGQFELALIPFNSFLELTAPMDQKAALAAVFNALKPRGQFICTLHNPEVRLRSIGGGMTTLGQYPVEGTDNEVVLKADLHYDSSRKIVEGVQILEVLDSEGWKIREHSLQLSFTLLSNKDFQDLFSAAGFEKEALYGDYRRAEFHEMASPYMIWSLRRKR